jgi:signal transduction histidine kinase
MAAERGWLARLGDGLRLFRADDRMPWRQRLVELLIAVGAIYAPIGLLAALPVHIYQASWATIAFGFGCWAFFLVLFFVRRGSYRLRAGLLLLVIYTAATVFLISLGPGYARPVWFTVCALIATLLFGMRAAVIAPLVSAAILLVVFLLSDPADPAWAGEHGVTAANTWTMFLANFVLLSYAGCLVVGAIIQTLERSLAEEQRVRRELAAEGQALQRAYDELQQQTAQRRWLESRLERAQRLEAIGSAAGTMAHDLNNMLMPIAAYSEMLKSRLADDPIGCEQLDKMLEAARRAEKLVGEVLAFGREIEPEQRPVPLAPLAEEVVGQLALEREPGLRAEVAAADRGVCALAEPTALHRALGNLARNGLAAMDTHGLLRLEIELIEREALDQRWALQLAGHQRYALIRVSDSGCGMDAETQQRAFEPFFTTKPGGAGTGLGLASVQRIVHAFGGLIEVDSTPGAGTTFTLVLPGTRADKDQPCEPHPATGRRGAHSSNSSSARAR